MLTRRLLPLAAAIALCLALGTSAALAASDSVPFHGTYHAQFVDSFTITDAPCAAGQAGQATVLVNIDLRYINSPTLFQFEGTETHDIRVDFPDGTYLIGASTARLEESANAGARYVKDTNIDHGQATLYAADGSAIGPVRWESTSHATWADLNGNQQLDPGEVTGGIDQFRVVSCP